MGLPESWRRRFGLGRVLFEALGVPWTIADVIAVFTSGGVLATLAGFVIDVATWIPDQSPVVVVVAVLTAGGFGVFVASAVLYFIRLRQMDMVTVGPSVPFRWPMPDPCPVQVSARIQANKRTDDYAVELRQVAPGGWEGLPCALQWVDTEKESREILKLGTRSVLVATVTIAAPVRGWGVGNARAETVVHAIGGPVEMMWQSVPTSDNGDYRWRWTFEVAVAGRKQNRTEVHPLQVEVIRRASGAYLIKASPLRLQQEWRREHGLPRRRAREGGITA